MNYLYLVLAIVSLLIAHLLKILRQSQFIEIYEEPNMGVLRKGLSLTYVINLIFPFKIGNLYRIIYPGKKMKNGVSFSLATIIIDILLDYFTVTLLYIIFYFVGLNCGDNIVFYIASSLTIIVVGFLAIILKKYAKKLILVISSIFNDKIELKLLKTSWFTITSFKDMIKKINKPKLLLYTITPWFFYLLSYYLICRSLFYFDSNIDFMNIFNLLYGRGNLIIPTLYLLISNKSIIEIVSLIIYIVTPTLIIFLLSMIPSKTKSTNKEYINLLPHWKMEDRFMFLQGYFSSKSPEYYKRYIELNSDIAIIEDYSAGSNATTMLCMKNNELFYRKYSFGDDAKKLKEQIDWIEEHNKKLTLTKIINSSYKNDLCSYDMPYIKDAVTCFNYVHTMPFNDSWNVIKKALDDISDNLHTINKRKSDKKTIEKYIDSKVLSNIEKIEKGEYIKQFDKYDYIYINGIKYKNLNYYKKYLNKEYLTKIFENDFYSDIHGDFTIENIICIKNSKSKKNYYIIDPNTGNLHNSPYLDFAKLLQSIHGGYEFLMNTKSVSYENDNINFVFAKSSVYDKLLDKYKKYLEDKFGREALKSIFYHEVIHWLRLMPYKINKNGDRSLLFYAGLIMVLNDVEEMFEK